jgi:hypothetical protein
MARRQLLQTKKQFLFKATNWESIVSNSHFFSTKTSKFKNYCKLRE